MNLFVELSNKCDDIRNQHPYCELILVGDFNAHHREWLNHQDTNCAGRQAEWFATSHDLTQIVSDSTFELPNSTRVHILDLCLTTIPQSMEARVEAGIGSLNHNLINIEISIGT